MARQIINMTMAPPKVSDPTEKAIDVTSYREGGVGDFSGGGGSFYMQKLGVADSIVQTKITGSLLQHQFSFHLKTTNGDDVTPDMNPTVQAYSVTMEPWGVSGHTEVGVYWEYNTVTGLYEVTLEDGAESPYGYSFFFGTGSVRTQATQQPNLFMTYWTTHASIPNYTLFMPSETPYDATIYWGIFRFDLSQDCTPITPVLSSSAIYDSTATSISGTNHCVGTRWKDGWRELLLSWDEAVNLDPNGYWVMYHGDNSITQQYPRKYVKSGTSSPDWFDPVDLIPPEDYSDAIIWFSFRHEYQDVDQDTVTLVEVGSSNCFNMVGGTFIRDVAGTAYSAGYPGYTGVNGLIYKPDGGAYYHYLIVKCSVGYQVKYTVKDSMELGIFQSPNGSTCNQENATIFVETDVPALTYSATNRTGSPPVYYQNYPASCVEVKHFVASFFKDAQNAGMQFAASDRFATSIVFVKLV